MKEEIKIEIDKIMANLPERDRQAINSMDWASKVTETAERQGLERDEIDLVIVETALVLLGLNDQDTFKENLEELALSDTDLDKMISKISNQIFTPIARQIELKIKEEAKTNNPDWQKRVNFILSGGDYTNLIK